MMTATCSYCKALLAAGNVYCMNCGTPIAFGDDTPTVVVRNVRQRAPAASVPTPREIIVTWSADRIREIAIAALVMIGGLLLLGFIWQLSHPN